MNTNPDRMKCIYVAGPYTGKSYSEIDDNIRRAEDLSILLFQAGWAVLTPHKNTAHYEVYEKVGKIDYHTWLNSDLEMLRRCDAMVCLPRWEQSTGTLGEISFARKNNIPLFFPVVKQSTPPSPHDVFRPVDGFVRDGFPSSFWKMITPDLVDLKF